MSAAAEIARRRILVLPHWYPWPDRPMEGAFCREQARVAARAHDVVVLAYRARPGLRTPIAVEEADEEGLRTFRVQVWRSRVPTLSFFLQLLGLFVVLARLRLRDGWRPEVIHAHEFDAGVLAAILALLTRSAVVLTEHSSALALGLLDAKHRAIARWSFRRAAVVCPVSGDLARRIAPLTGNTPIVPVPNPVNDELFRLHASSAHDGVRLLTVGSLVEVKGHSYLLDALEKVRSAGVDAELDIVGDGPLRQALQAQAQALGIEQHVRFHGFQPQARVAAMTPDADLFVLPSLWETQGCALVEAMAAGLQVVASDVGGVPEALDHTDGLLVAPRDADALSGAILAALERGAGHDPDRTRAHVLARHGHDALARRWTEIYDSVASGSNRFD